MNIMLSEKATNQFIEIYKKEFGEKLTNHQAQEKGEKLLRLFSLIYKPIPKDWIKKVLSEESIKR